MINEMETRSSEITSLLNGTITAIKNVVPMELSMSKPRLSERVVQLQFGVLIGITGDIKGKMILTGDSKVFGSIGEKMFGMPLEGEMLASFSGELGNMVAGGMATNVGNQGVRTDITSPTIIEGDTTLSGYEKALIVPVTFDDTGAMDIYLLLD